MREPNHNSGKVRFILISNIITLALCVLVIVGYLAFPFWTVSLSVSISDTLGEAAEELIRTSPMNDTEKETVAEFIRTAKSAHLSASVSVSVYSTDILGVLFSSDPHYTEDQVKRLLFQTASQASDLVKALLEISGNTAIRITYLSILSDAIKKSGLSSDAIDEVRNRAGLSEDWMSLMISRITDAANEEQATTDSVLSVIMDVADETKDRLSSVPEYTGLALQFEQSKPEIRSSIREMLKEAEDETGKIQPDLLINQILGPYILLAGQTISWDSGVDSPVSEAASSSFSVSESLSDFLEEAASEWIDSLRLSESHQLTHVLQILAGTILGVWLVWLLVFIVVLVRTLIRKYYAPVLWIPFIFGWPHYLLLCLIPSILAVDHFSLLRSILMPFLNQFLPLGDETIRAFADSIRLTFSSGTLLSCVSAVLLFVLFFVYCGVWKAAKQDAGSYPVSTGARFLGENG